TPRPALRRRRAPAPAQALPADLQAWSCCDPAAAQPDRKPRRRAFRPRSAGPQGIVQMTGARFRSSAMIKRMLYLILTIIFDTYMKTGRHAAQMAPKHDQLPE